MGRQQRVADLVAELVRVSTRHRFAGDDPAVPWCSHLFFSQFDRLGPAPGARRNAGRHSVALVRVGPVRIAISALAPFRPPGWGSVGCRTFVELNLSGALDARHHLGDLDSVSGGLCQVHDAL